MTRRLLILLLILLLGAISVAACAIGRPERVWLQSPGWSRGVSLGSTALVDAPSMALLPDDQLALVRKTDDDQAAFTLTVMNLETGGWTDHPLAEPSSQRASQLRLLADGSRLWLLWLDTGELLTTEIGTDGQLLSGPAPLGDGRQLHGYAVSAHPNGEPAVVLGYQDGAPGVSLRNLAQDLGSLSLAAHGSAPAAAYDESGRLHVAWFELPEASGQANLRYGSVDQRLTALAVEATIASFSLGASDVLEGPQVSLAAGRVYLAYTISIRTGLRAGDVDSMLVSFPIYDPSQLSRSYRLSVPTTGDPAYELPAAGLQTGPRAQLTDGTYQITQLALPAQTTSELLALARARVDFLMNQTQTQIVALYGSGVEPGSYQLLTFTNAGSSHPAVLTGSAGESYVAWLEPAEEAGWLVYLASTRPSLVEAYASLTGQDVQQMALQSIFGMLSGVILMPMVLIWLIAPLLTVAVTSFLRGGDEGLGQPTTFGPLALGLAGYWIAKRAILPQVFEYVPFSAWIPVIPGWLEPVLRYGFPVAGSLLGLWLAYHFTYRRDRNAPLFFVLIFGAVDGLVTMAIFGGLVLGF